MLTALFKFLPNGRLTQLLLLAVTVLVQSVMAIAVANSIFVSQLGAGRLPLAFILIGLCSMPAYIGVSQVVQRVRSTQLFCGALVILLVSFVGLRLLLPLELTPIYYGLLIVSFFQWDICNNILYPSLLTDYFNTLEYKQYAPYIGISQAVGTLIGGGLVSGLSRWLDTENLLLCLPGVIVISFLQLIYLDRTQRPLTTTPTETVGVLESLQSFPELTKRYPLVIFLATSSFLLVIIYLSSEFLWFSIYGQQFSQRDLTGFLGLMRVVVSIVQMAVLYGLTRPLLRWLGVARMNVVFPLTTLTAFVGLGLNGQLPAAIGLQINGDALYKAINLPVHQLNYNAIPQAFLGRIRALSDGVIYAVGLTCAGAFLWVCEHTLSLEQISWVVCSLVVVFLLVRLPMGRFYAAGLEDLIRTDAIDLDRLASRQSVLPLRATVETLLRSEDRYDQIKGLDLATRFGAPIEFLDDVLALLPGADRQVRSAVVTLFSDGFDQGEGSAAEADEMDEAALWAVWQEQLEPEQPLACRLTALEILMVQQQPIESTLLAELSSHEDASLQALARVAQLQGTAATADLTENFTEIAPSMLDEGVAKAVIRVVARSADETLLKLLTMRLLPEGTAETRRLGLETLATLIETMPDDDKTRALALAKRHLSHAQPEVRTAALALWQQGHTDLAPLAAALGDPHLRVRNQAAQWLAAQGGLAEAQAQLNSGDRNTVNGAIAAIGQIRTRRASDILYGHLADDFQQVSHTRQWQLQIPLDDPNWQPLAVAIADYHYRLIQKVLYVLSSLGHSRTVNTVNQIFVTTDSRDRSNAVEVLASLSHRRFILPLLPLLEQDAEGSSSVQTRQSSLNWLRKKGYKILLEAIESKDRWLRAGALIALAKIPRASLSDVDPVVRAVAHDLFPTVPLSAPLLQGVSTVPSIPDTLMNRLLILKDVALFQNLSLDELLLIDEALVPQQFMASETVFEEGSWGSHLYIIASGTVQIVKTVEDEQREIKQLEKSGYFGEIALFDDAPRWNGAFARDDCMLLKLEKQRFISLTTQRPHILLEICRFMSQQLRETDKFRSAKKFVANPADVVDETLQSC